MFRRLLAAVGVLEILAPEALVDAGERVAAERPDAPERKSWVVPVARAQGVVYLFLAWRSEAAYSAFKTFLGVLGVVLTLFPRRFVDGATAVAYQNSEGIEWKPWTYSLARVLGPVYVLVGLRELRK